MTNEVSELLPSVRFRLPTTEQIEQVSEFDFTCARSEKDLFIFKDQQEAEAGQFMPTLLGTMQLNQLPKFLPPEMILRGMLEEMRDASAARDVEFHGGIYRNNGDYFLLENPSLGGFNPLDNYYFAGPAPVIKDHDMVVDIHSHPPCLRFKSSETPEVTKMAKNVPSMYDFGKLLHLPETPNLKHVQSTIIVGQEIVSLFARTKNSPPKHPRKDRKGHWLFAKTINKLIQIDREIKDRHQQLTNLGHRLMAIHQVCQEYKLG